MKMNLFFKSLYIFMLAVTVLCGCQPTQQLSNFSALPDSFPGQTDTTSMASVRWREFFSNPHLVALIDSALQSNFDVRAAWQRMEIAKAGVVLNKGMLKPTVAIGTLVSQRKFGLYTMDGAGNITTDIETGQIVPIHLRDYYPAIQASWEVYAWGKLRNRKRAALNRLLASQEGRNMVVTELIAEVATRYYELMGLDTELTTLNENISLQERAYQLILLQKEAAAANELAVKQFEAQLLNSKGLRAEVRQQMLELENYINFLLGRFPQSILRDSLSDVSLPEQMNAGIPAALLLNRPDIRQAHYELQASGADVKAAKAAFYPSLNLSGNIGFQAYKASLLFLTPESYAYGLFGSLTAPLFNRSALQAELKFANAQQHEALINYERSLVNGYNEVVNHLNAIRNLEEVYELKEQEVSAWSQSVETSTELFRTGRATYLEIILTQQNTLQAKRELINVRERQLIAMVNLYRALGGGWR